VGLISWAIDNRERMEKARAAYDRGIPKRAASA
jgi:hypothetical protein